MIRWPSLVRSPPKGDQERERKRTCHSLNVVLRRRVQARTSSVAAALRRMFQSGASRVMEDGGRTQGREEQEEEESAGRMEDKEAFHRCIEEEEEVELDTGKEVKSERDRLKGPITCGNPSNITAVRSGGNFFTDVANVTKNDHHCSTHKNYFSGESHAASQASQRKPASCSGKQADVLPSSPNIKLGYDSLIHSPVAKRSSSNHCLGHRGSPSASPTTRRILGRTLDRGRVCPAEAIVLKSPGRLTGRAERLHAGFVRASVGKEGDDNELEEIMSSEEMRGKVTGSTEVTKVMTGGTEDGQEEVISSEAVKGKVTGSTEDTKVCRPKVMTGGTNEPERIMSSGCGGEKDRITKRNEGKERGKDIGKKNWTEGKQKKKKESEGEKSEPCKPAIETETEILKCEATREQSAVVSTEQLENITKSVTRGVSVTTPSHEKKSVSARKFSVAKKLSSKENSACIPKLQEKLLSAERLSVNVWDEAAKSDKITTEVNLCGTTKDSDFNEYRTKQAAAVLSLSESETKDSSSRGGKAGRVGKGPYLSESTSKHMRLVRTRRLMKEYQELRRTQAGSHDPVFTVELVNDCLYEWTVRLMRVDPESELHRDMEQLGIHHILLSLSFPDNFPFHPPFLRVLSPPIEKGFVMEGGAICMELLTPRGWASAYTIEAVIMQFAASLVKGQGRVSRKKKAPRDLSRRSAESSFRSLVKTHEKYGWVTPPLAEG